MLSVGEFFACFFGPKLYMEYETGFEQMANITVLEEIGGQILATLSLGWKISYYMSPMIVVMLYRRGYFEAEACMSWLKFALIIMIIMLLGIGLRGLGRLESKAYRRLVKALKLAKSPPTAEEGKLALMKFDFDFRWWPVDFDMKKVNSDKEDEGQRTFVFKMPKINEDSSMYGIKKLPRYLAGYCLIHTFGIRILYPGSSRIVQGLLRPNIIAERAILMREKNAKRYKLKTVDRNEIDAAFIDNRGKGHNGDILIISSEGNVGYYPLGVMNTAVGREFSILGWNHPGFDSSTGNPFPAQEFNAIDAVMQFAIHKLRFKVNDIILYGWSIGGFSALCGASKYTQLKGVILDGTFDDIYQLAIVRVPPVFLSIVEAAIRCHCNLNNVGLIRLYNGPISLIRRTYDETIAHNGRIDSNRGNVLALELLTHRYPDIFQPNQVLLAQNLFSKPFNQLNEPAEYDEDCERHLRNYTATYGKIFPLHIGQQADENFRNQMAKFLLRKHCRDFRSSHCPLLPVEYFTIPWDIQPVDDNSSA